MTHRTIWTAACTALLLATTSAISPGAHAADNTSCLFYSANPDDKSGPPVHFAADLSAYEESAVTDSPGKGHVDFVIDRATLKLTWKATFEGLTSPPIGLHVHGPATAGNEGAVLFDMAPNGVKSPVAGERVLTDGEVTYLAQDRLYVNIQTKKYPTGELRGPISKIRPKC